MIRPRPAVTKFVVPPLPQTLIPRPELLGRLDHAVRCPCTLVAGSPGGGKTVLLASWVSRRPQGRIAWVSCDRWDKSEVRFWTSIASALSRLDSELATDALDLLTEGPDTIEDVVASLVNDLASSPAPTCLVLDDLHVVPPAALGGLATFVERLPASFHVVMASRSDPVLPLQRWRTRGSLAEIRDADLRLSDEDMVSLLANFSLDLSGDDVRTLAERTEGWVTGVKLAALSLQGGQDRSSFMSRFSGSDHVVADFLLDEVLSHQSSEMVSFLKATSVVEEFDVTLANLLAPGGKSAHLLNEAVSSGLFLEAVGGDSSRYRFHQLFRELLRAELAAEDPTAARTLHVRAGSWYEETGQYGLALDQFVEASDIDRAFAILHEHGPDAWFSGSGAELGAWIERFSGSQIRAQRWRMLDYAFALGAMGRVEEQGHWLARASSALGEEEDRAFEIRLEATQAQWHGLRGETAPACAFERNVFSNLTPGDDPFVDQFPVISARAHLYEDDPGAALVTCDSALLRADPVGRPVLLGIRARAMFEVGELLTAHTTATDAMDLARRSGLDTHPGLFDAVLTLAGLALEADQLDSAEQLIEEALRRGEGTRPPFEVMALVERAALFGARQDHGEALSSLDRARGALPAGSRSPLWSRIDALEARIRIELGDAEGALTLVQALPASAQRHLIEASAWAAIGQLPHTQTCLSHTDQEEQGPRLAIAACLLQAGVDQQLGLDHDAELRRAVSLARPQQFIRTLLTGSPGLTDSLIAHLVHLPGDPYVDNLLVAAERMQARHVAGPAGSSEGTLSEREQGVLGYLPTRLTTREIADELYISMNTLKSHLKSIYRKLDASSRTDAVTHARGLGML